MTRKPKSADGEKLLTGAELEQAFKDAFTDLRAGPSADAARLLKGAQEAQARVDAARRADKQPLKTKPLPSVGLEGKPAKAPTKGPWDISDECIERLSRPLDQDRVSSFVRSRQQSFSWSDAYPGRTAKPWE